MTAFDLTAPTSPTTSRRALPWLLALFVGSGCAAMIYEVVWLQLLQLVIGSTAASLAVPLTSTCTSAQRTTSSGRWVVA